MGQKSTGLKSQVRGSMGRNSTGLRSHIAPSLIPTPLLYKSPVHISKARIVPRYLWERLDLFIGNTQLPQNSSSSSFGAYNILKTATWSVAHVFNLIFHKECKYDIINARSDSWESMVPCHSLSTKSSSCWRPWSCPSWCPSGPSKNFDNFSTVLDGYLIKF